MHANAVSSATAALAAGEQGKFFEMHDILFAKQEEWSKSKDVSVNYISYAASLNLDLEKFKQDLKSEELKNKVIALYQEGVSAGIKGTPSFFINGEKIEQKGTTGEEIANNFIELLNKKLTENIATK
jgi:protein-disulfide isomerase